MIVRRLVVAAVFGVLAAAPAGAQTWSDSLAAQLARESRASACVRAIPVSAYTRAPVFLHAEVVDSADAPARPFVDVSAQEVAPRVQRLLRGDRAEAAGRLPALDSALGRPASPAGEVRFVARRGGQLAWRLEHPPDADTAALALVSRGLRLAHDEAPFAIVDDAFRGDSLAFTLAFAQPFRVGSGPWEIRVRNPAPLFTTLQPPERQAALKRGLRLRYPAELQRGGFEGRVVVSFVVDAAGRAEANTFREARPAAVAALRPELRRPYGLFLAAVRDAVLRAEFEPAALGGCPVRQLVQLPVTFQLER